MLGGWYKAYRAAIFKYGLETYLTILVLSYFFIVWMPHHADEAGLVWEFMLGLLPFALPILLAQVLWEVWYDYVRQKKYWTTPHTVLEIRLPEEITQSPYAAELFMRVLYQTGEVDTPLHGFRGETKPWFSLEIVSTEGRVKFYIWTRTRYKEIVKAQMYAHYPSVQIVEVEDYTLSVPWDPAVVDLWGIEQNLQKPDPYPIMTYVAWQLDKEKKEEFKSDPMLSIIEFFGTLGPGENAWMQIIIRGHTTSPWAHEKGIHEKVNVEAWAEHEIADIAKKTIKEEGDQPNFMQLSDGEKEKIKAMQAKSNKQLFDVGIRSVYVARHENRNPVRNAGFPTAMRSFEHGSEGRGLNGLKPIFWIGPFNWPWEDFMGVRRSRLKRRMYENYVTRQYFYAPAAHYHIAMNTEELASLWHLPGSVAHTPTLERMPSKRSEAPANLPV